ncbi:MAG: LysR family transcriptional regulator [Proteobacteria bacterium]|nr:LysR family transcriptional regulator [Pseudomonadota bacterium]
MAKNRVLPPLPSLLAFEAAARLQNFSQAAAVLGMTQSAISQHVTMLEQTIGQPLFRRLHRGVVLTEAGVTLHGAVGRGLDTIESAMAELRREPRMPALSIATDFGFASFWLMPRLEALARALPEVEVRIVTSQHAPHQAQPDTDVTIVFGSSGAGSTLLFVETVVPVCSPAFLERHRGDDGAVDWARLPLLDLEGPEPARWLSWHDWFALMRLSPRRRRETMVHLNTYPLVVEAAMLGQGAALGWQPLVDRHLSSGALVAMTAERVTTDRGYALIEPPAAAGNPAVPAFRRWLLAECGTGGSSPA